MNKVKFAGWLSWWVNMRIETARIVFEKVESIEELAGKDPIVFANETRISVPSSRRAIRFAQDYLKGKVKIRPSSV